MDYLKLKARIDCREVGTSCLCFGNTNAKSTTRLLAARLVKIWMSEIVLLTLHAERKTSSINTI